SASARFDPGMVHGVAGALASRAGRPLSRAVPARCLLAPRLSGHVAGTGRTADRQAPTGGRPPPVLADCPGLAGTGTRSADVVLSATALAGPVGARLGEREFVDDGDFTERTPQ